MRCILKKSAQQSSTNQSNTTRSSWQHIKRLGVFQLKLLADALRDLLLSPLSLIVTLLDLVESDPSKRHHFDRLMALGRRTERKIDLFEQHKDNNDGAASIDQLVDQIEQVIKREYSEGQVSGKTKAVLDKAIGRLRKNTPAEKDQTGSDATNAAAPK